MFFISVGHGTTQYDHGPILPLTCPRCSQVTYWKMLQHSSSTSLYFVPVSTNNKYYLQCQSCGYSTMLSSEQAQRAFYLKPITLAFFNKEISEQEYRDRLNEVKYLH